MPIKGLAPWFGGKRNLAPTIVKLLGRHRVYWEPFCGSCAVLLAKPPCVMETVNDLHGDLINLARVLKNEDLALQLYNKLSRTLVHEQLFKEAAERYKIRGYYAAQYDPPEIDRAYDYILFAWLGTNGVAGTPSYNQGFSVRYTASGGHAAKRWQSVIESIPAWHYRLANVTILNRDAFELLERIEDNEGTAIYVDPPYIEKGAKYIHDFKSEDHQRLAEMLLRFKKTRIVVSYYDHSILNQLYPSWWRKKINISKALSNAGSRGEKDIRAIEVLLTNFEIESGMLFRNRDYGRASL